MSRSFATGIILASAAVGLIAVGTYQQANAHCQVPCGIYDDPARIAAMLEDAQTIAKAMAEIDRLDDQDTTLATNQTVRWINTKEAHASHIITTVAEYFLTQKVKEADKGSADYDKYLASLATHHHVMRLAMKTKQTVDPANADMLRAAILDLGKLYGYRP